MINDSPTHSLAIIRLSFLTVPEPVVLVVVGGGVMRHLVGALNVDWLYLSSLPSHCFVNAFYSDIVDIHPLCVHWW